MPPFTSVSLVHLQATEIKIYKPINSPVVFHGCKTCLLTTKGLPEQREKISEG